MKKLLVPTDFSTCAGYAIDVAIMIARQTKAEIHYLHAINTPIDWSNIDFLTASAAMLPPNKQERLFPEVKEAIGKADHLLDQLVSKTLRSEVNAKKHLVYNVPATEITTYAKAWNSDLIVMGSHGASGFKEAFIGSNAQKIVRTATCPVITVRKEISNFMINDIIYASDFIDRDMTDNLEQVSEFAKIFNARIHLLHVNTPAYFEDTGQSMERLEKQKDQYNLTAPTLNIYNDFTVEYGIVAFAKKQEADLIAITTHGYRGLRRMINNNVTEYVVNHSDIPVMTLHPKKAG